MFTLPDDDDEDILPPLPVPQCHVRDNEILNNLRQRNEWVKIYHDALRGLSSRSDVRFALFHISEQFSLRRELFRRQNRLHYWGEPNVKYTRAVIQIPHDDPLQNRMASVDSSNVKMLLWRWWWSRFTVTLAPANTSFFHHPAAIEFLLETFKAMDRWQNWRQDMSTVKQCLKSALRPIITEFQGFAQGNVQRHTTYLEDIIEATAQAVVLGRIDVAEGCDHAVAPKEAYGFEDHMRIWNLQ
jgi:hypothetical protein